MASVYDYTFQCQALEGLLSGPSGPADRVLVTHWRGTEAVSRPYRFEVTFAIPQADLSLETLLDKPATLTTKVPDGGTRQWHGIITRASEAGSDEIHHYYQVVLEPRLARLRNMQWSDIYLKRDLADLIKQLLEHAGLNNSYSSENAPYDYRIAATQLSQTRTEFTCQYEETCLDFLMRKLEYHGVYFWFEQGSSQESVVFANDVAQQPGDSDAAVYYPKGMLDADARQTAILRLNRHVDLTPRTVVLHGSQEHANTTLNLASEASVPSPAPLEGLGEIHSASEHFEQVEGDASVSGAALAQWRAQELACRRLRAQGEANTPGIRAGRFLNVSEYQRGINPRQYYVIEVTHEGTQAIETTPQTDIDAYRAAFVALPRWLDPAKPTEPLQFRPRRVTPVPQVTRLLNGFVDVANPNQPKRFAQPDANGRYKVRFLFARQRYDGEQNSAFVRMATPYAGGASVQGLSNAGMHFPLREGTEVLIAFLRGNPDRPVIVAALPNIEAPSPVDQHNPGDHVINTPAGNRLVLADATPDGGDGTPYVQAYSPVGKSTINLGTSDQGPNGFHLATEQHGTIHAGESMLIEVPGHYRVAAGTAKDDSMRDFLGSMKAAAVPGITAGQSGGIVVTDFLGANISSVEGITVNHFLGVRSNLSEAATFDTTLGAKLTVEAVKAKTVNLIQKLVLADKAEHTNSVTEWITTRWNGIAAEKSDKAANISITALEKYSLTSTAASVTATEKFTVQTPSFTADTANTSLRGAAELNLIGADSEIALIEEFINVLADCIILQGRQAVAVRSPKISLLSPNIEISSPLVLLGE